MPKGSGGTHVSIHDGYARDGESPRTYIVITNGRNASVMASDMMEVGTAHRGHSYSDMSPKTTVRRDGDSITVTGEGGNVKDIISAMVDAILPSTEPASAALKATAA